MTTKKKPRKLELRPMHCYIFVMKIGEEQLNIPPTQDRKLAKRIVRVWNLMAKIHDPKAYRIPRIEFERADMINNYDAAKIFLQCAHHGYGQ